MNIPPQMTAGASNPQSTWTQEQRDEIAVLLRKGKTAKQIAARFGRSKGAIMGIVWRDRVLREIGFARSPGENLGISRIAANAGDRRKASRGGVISKNRLKPVPKPALVAPVTSGVSLMDLGPRQCKFCINSPEQGSNAHLFCGEVTGPGKSWCAWHETIVWQQREAERLAA